MKKELFYKSFLQLKTKEEVKRYLRDLLTMDEINEFTERLTVADMLYKNKTYIEIEKKTSMSSRTIARINKWLQNGRNGYKLILDRLHTHHNSSTRLRED